MTVVEVKAKDTLLASKFATMCTDSNIIEHNGIKNISGEPTEIALVQNGLKYNLNKNDLYREMPRVAEIPFDSNRKMMTTIHKYRGKYLVITKGAPDILLNKCNLTSIEKRRLEKENQQMAEKALRVIAVSYKKIDSLPRSSEMNLLENGLNFVG